MVDIFFKGGPIMIPLFFCSVVGLSIILERIWYFYRVREKKANAQDKLLSLFKKNDYRTIIHLSETAKNPFTKVLHAGVAAYMTYGEKANLEKVMHGAANREIRKWVHHLGGLNLIANVTPLMGLLGTVTGMIKCFMQIEASGGRVDVVLLAGGIWEAMLTTAFGLTVAIPCLLFHNFAAEKASRIEKKSKETVEDLLNIIQQRENNGI